MNRRQWLAGAAPLLALDMAGLALLGLGAAEQFGRGHILPAGLRFEGVGVAVMALGLACMAPIMVYTLRVARRIRQEEDAWVQDLPEQVKAKLLEKINRGSRQ